MISGSTNKKNAYIIFIFTFTCMFQITLFERFPSAQYNRYLHNCSKKLQLLYDILFSIWYFRIRHIRKNTDPYLPLEKNRIRTLDKMVTFAMPPDLLTYFFRVKRSKARFSTIGIYSEMNFVWINRWNYPSANDKEALIVIIM